MVRCELVWMVIYVQIKYTDEISIFIQDDIYIKCGSRSEKTIQFYALYFNINQIKVNLKITRHRTYDALVDYETLSIPFDELKNIQQEIIERCKYKHWNSFLTLIKRYPELTSEYKIREWVVIVDGI